MKEEKKKLKKSTLPFYNFNLNPSFFNNILKEIIINIYPIIIISATKLEV